MGIDARLYGVASGTGIGRYTEELLRALADLTGDDPRLAFVVFLRSDGFEAFTPPHGRWTKVLADFRPYTWSVQTALPRLLREARLDLVHFTHFDHPLRCPTSFVTTIHDCILLDHPSIRASTLDPIRFWTKYVGYRMVLRHATMAGAGILTPSAATATVLHERLRVPRERITVTALGVDHVTMRGATPSPMTRDPPRCPYLLSIGNAYPHKNLAQLSRVLPLLRTHHPDLRIILVGREDDFLARLRNPIHDRTPMVFTGELPDAEVRELLAHALAYVSPSRCEGFDLPTLEAAALGTPVIASDIPAHHEVLGDAALFFPQDDDRALVNAIHRLTMDRDLRGILGRRGRARAHAYSWRTCAERTLDAYRACRHTDHHPHAAVHPDAARRP